MIENSGFVKKFPMFRVSDGGKEMDKLDKVLDCKTIFEQDIKRVRKFIHDFALAPTLEIITMTDDPASQVYVRNKMKDCERLHIQVKLTELKKEWEQDVVVEAIESSIAHGIIVQLPLPEHINTHEVLQCIPWYKDVDGMTTMNRGGLFEGDAWSYAATASGIYDAFKKEYNWNIPLEGKHCVIINRSNLVGKPLSLMMMAEGATVTVCNSHTVDLKKYTQDADILVVAVGKPKFITADMVKPDSIVIDVGINKDENGKLCGDVDFENVKEVVGHITPVPNGVGLLTRGALLENLAWCTLYQTKYCGMISELENLGYFDENSLWRKPFTQSF